MPGRPLLYDLFVDISMLCTSPGCTSAHLHHVITHALYVGFIFCHGKPEGPYHLLNYAHGALRPQMRKLEEMIFRALICVNAFISYIA